MKEIKLWLASVFLKWSLDLVGDDLPARSVEAFGAIAEDMKSL